MELNEPTLGFLLSSLGCLWLAVRLWLTPKLSAPAIPRAVTKKIRKLYKDGQITAAAGMLESNGSVDAAVSLLRTHNHLSEAAQLLKRQGRFRDAGMCLAQCSNWQEAMNCFEKAHMPFEAASCAMKLDDFVLAARLFESSGDFNSAAACYSMTGAHLKSCQLYLKLGALDRAAESLLNLTSAELRTFRPGEIPAPVISELLGRTTDHDALPILIDLAGGHVDIPGLILDFVSRRNVGQALALFQFLGPEAAAALLTRSVHLDKGPRLVVAELLGHRGFHSSAGELFAMCHAFSEASHSFEQGGDMPRALAMAIEAGQWERVDDLRSRIEMRRKALDNPADGTGAKAESAFSFRSTNATDFSEREARTTEWSLHPAPT